MVEWWENNEDYNPLIHDYEAEYLVTSFVFLDKERIVYTSGQTIRLLRVVGTQTGAQAQNGGAEELDFSLLRF